MNRFFESLWPIAIISAAACVVLILATFVMVLRARVRARRHARGLDRVREQLPALLASGADRTGAVTELPLSLVREASAGLAPAEEDQVRRRLINAGTASSIESRAMHARRRWRRAAQLELLGWMRAETSLGVLERILAGDDSDLAYIAAQSLAAYGSAGAYGVLTDALVAERLSRSRIATLLESARYAGAVEALDELSSHPDGSVRFWVAYLLGRTADPAARAPLERLAGDDDSNVRANAVEGLGRLGHSDAIGTLLADPDWVVRSHAATAAGAAAMDELAPRLCALLTDQVWWVRHNAARSLVELGRAADQYVVPLLRSHDRFARNKAAEVLVADGFVDQQVATALAESDGEAARATGILIAVASAEAQGSVRSRLERAGDANAARLLQELDRASVISAVPQ